MADKPAPHLRDLFLKGKEIEIEYPGISGVKLWVQRPSSVQQDFASRAARSKKTRRRAELLNPESDERRALEMEMAEADPKSVVEQLVSLNSSDYQKQALNEVLYSSDHGSNWGEAGEKYMDLLDAVIQRSEELTELAQAEGRDVPDFVGDEEWNRLNDLQQQFQDEVSARYQEIADDVIDQTLIANDADKIRADYIKRHIEAEADVEWYMEYKMHMVYYAVRDPEDHKKLYFENATEVAELPSQVQQQILKAVEDLAREVDELKNSLTPLPS